MGQKKIALVFAGAGASKAVNAERYPTTREFYGGLPAEIKKNEILNAIAQWFRATTRKQTEILDIEVVLWALDELSSFLEDLREAQSFPMFALRRDYLTKWVPSQSQGGSRPSVGSILQRYPLIAPKLESLRSEITARVYDLYAELPSRNELEQNWLPLLGGLLDAGFRLELFTTNYDLVLEQALIFLKSPLQPTTGRQGGVVPVLDLDTWKHPLRDHGALTKLHGSVDWSRAANGQVLVGNPQYKGDHKRHVIIYPGFKGTPQSEEIILFHNYFSKAASEAALLVFIGFAFRDEYLNSLIADSLRPDSLVLIINPASSLPNLPLSDDRVVHEKLPFDNLAVERCLQVAQNPETSPDANLAGPNGAG